MGALLLALLLTVSGAAGPLAPDAGDGWTSIRTDLDVTVVPAQARLRVGGTLTLRLDAPASFGPALWLNSGRDLMRFVRIEAPGATSTINESAPDAPGTLLARVRFDRPLQRGAIVKVAFEAESQKQGFTFVVAGRAAVVASSNGWYPQPVPQLGAKFDAETERTTGLTRFHVPPGWRSLSNGVLRDRRATDAEVTETWAVDAPLPRSFAAGPYTVYRRPAGGREIAMYLLAPKATGGAVQAASLGTALTILTRHFGAYPYRSYSVAEVPDDLVRWYGLEARDFTVERSAVFAYADGGLSIFAHEAAHGWWGNLVHPVGKGSYMLDEALAQYSSLIVIQAVEGQASYIDYLQFSRPGIPPQQCARGYFAMAKQGKDKPLAELVDPNADDYDLSDSKGTWFYHMLRRHVGDELFFATLRKLIAQYGDKPITLPDLRAAFVDAAPPDKQMRQFFTQWLDRTGAPALQLTWTPAGAGKVAVAISQTQASEPFLLALDVAVEATGGTRRETVTLRDRETRVVLAANGQPTGVRLDPDYELLLHRPEYDR